MGRIFWNFIARVAFIVGFVTASAHANSSKHEVPKPLKNAPSIAPKTGQTFRYCMPGSMGFTCTDEKTTAVLACSEQPDRLYKEVSVNPEGKLTDREGNVLPCTVATQNGAERSLRDGITVKKGALTPIGW